jgi:hypothetical protein
MVMLLRVFAGILIMLICMGRWYTTICLGPGVGCHIRGRNAVIGAYVVYSKGHIIALLFPHTLRLLAIH